MLKQRLLDVLALSIYPVLIAHRKPLFREAQAAKLRLTETKTFSKIVSVIYEPQY